MMRPAIALLLGDPAGMAAATQAGKELISSA